jgi:hypothetical protein
MRPLEAGVWLSGCMPERYDCGCVLALLSAVFLSATCLLLTACRHEHVAVAFEATSLATYPLDAAQLCACAAMRLRYHVHALPEEVTC